MLGSFNKNRFIALCVFLGGIAYHFSFFQYGINLADEGLLLELSERVYQGKCEYVDFLSAYPPGRYWIIAFLYKLVGIQVYPVRYLMVILTATIAVMIYQIARRFNDSVLAVIPAILFLIAPGVYYFRFYPFILCLNLLAWIKYLENNDLELYESSKNFNKRYKPIFIPSLAILVSFYFRPDLAFCSLIIGVILICIKHGFAPFFEKISPSNNSQVKNSWLKRIILECLFLLVIQILGLAYFWLNALTNPAFADGLKRIWQYFSIGYPKFWSIPFPSFPVLPAELQSYQWWRTNLRYLFYYLPALAYLCTLAVLIIRLVKFEKRLVGNSANSKELISSFWQNNKYWMPLLGFGFAAYAFFCIRTSFDYLLRVLPPFWILLTVFISWLYSQQKKSPNRIYKIFNRIALSLVLLLILSFCVEIIAFNGFYAGSIGIRWSEAKRLENARLPVYCSPEETNAIEQVVRFLQRHNPPHAYLYALPCLSTFNFASGYSNPLRYPWITPEGMISEQIQQDVIAEFEKYKIPWLVYVELQLDGMPERTLSEYAPLVYEYIWDNYYFVKGYDVFWLLRRNQ